MAYNFLNFNKSQNNNRKITPTTNFLPLPQQTVQGSNPYIQQPQTLPNNFPLNIQPQQPKTPLLIPLDDGKSYPEVPADNSVGTNQNNVSLLRLGQQQTNFYTPQYDAAIQNALKRYNGDDPRFQKISSDNQASMLPTNFLMTNATTTPKEKEVGDGEGSPNPEPSVENTPAEQNQQISPAQSPSPVSTQELQKAIENVTKSVNVPERQNHAGLNLALELNGTDPYPQAGTYPQEKLNKLNSLPLLDFGAMSQLNELNAAKNVYAIYEDIQKIAAENLNRTDLTDKEREEYQKTYDNAADTLSRAANFGYMTRQNLQKVYGVNADDYGLSADRDTYQDSNQAMTLLQQRDQSHLLNLPSAAEVEAQSYSDYVKGGASPFAASIWATQNANQARQNNSRQFADAMLKYGNSDGSLNDFTFALARRWAQDDPQSASLYLSGYASPAAQYQAGVNLSNTMLGQEGQNTRLTASLLADWLKHQDNLQLGYDTLTEKGREFNATNQLNIAKMNAEQANKEAENQLKLQKMILDNYDKDPVIRLQIAKYYADYLYGTEDSDAKTNYIATFTNPHHKPTDTSKADKVYNDLSNALQGVRHDLLNGTVDDDGNELAKLALEQIKADLRDPEKGYRSQLLPEQYHEIFTITTYYDKVLKKELSLWDATDQAWRLKYKRNPDQSENGDPIWYTNMSAEERELFDEYLRKERGFRRRTPTNSRTTTNREVYFQQNPYGLIPYFNNNPLWWGNR